MTAVLKLNEPDAIRRITEALIVDFGGRFTAVEVAAIVDRVHHRYDDAPIREFVPLMVERFARRELKDRRVDD